MDIYEIEPSGKGWFQVLVTAPNNTSWMKGGFVSEVAAQRWINKHSRVAIKTQAAR
jgi:hypothetical protein